MGDAILLGAIDPGRQVKLVLKEPKKRLPHTAKFGNF